MSIATIIKSIFTVNTPPTAAQLAELVKQAEIDLLEATRVIDRAQEQLDAKVFGLLAVDDKVGAARLRKAVRDAKERRDEAREDLDRARRQHAEAMKAEAHADLRLRWQDVDKKATFFVDQVALLQEAAERFSAAYTAAQKAGLELRDSVPERLSAAEESACLFMPSRLRGLTEVQLFAHTSGTFGRSGLTVWEVLRMPNLPARARETIALIMRPRRKAERAPTPPDAA